MKNIAIALAEFYSTLEGSLKKYIFIKVVCYDILCVSITPYIPSTVFNANKKCLWWFVNTIEGKLFKRVDNILHRFFSFIFCNPERYLFLKTKIGAALFVFKGGVICPDVFAVPHSYVY